MSADLPEKLLGIDINETEEPREDEEDEPEDLVRFLFVSIGERRLAVSVDDVKTVTDPPSSTTRVPRSPDAIAGVADLRGEVTVVIEPRVHFPVADAPATVRQLVVFDRPMDRQPAAMLVDEVYGVESVPEDAVRDDDEVGDDVAGGALSHPLVVGIVERERERLRGRSQAHARSRPHTGSDRSATGDDGGRTIVVETTPLVDVDDLLLASGNPA